MSMPVLRLVSSAAILAVGALSVGNAAAGDSLPLPEGHVETAEPTPGVADIVGTETSAAGEHADRRPARSGSAGSAEAGPSGESPEGAAVEPDADAEAQPASRLLRSLDAWAERPASASPSPSPEGTLADIGQTAAEAPIGGVLHGCPRALLASLLAEATETADAVSALAIERETLALCRERQEIVNGIVALEGELQALLAEAEDETGAPGTAAGPVGSADTPIVKVSAPVRVIEMAAPAPTPAETAETDTPPAPQSPAYSWFSIVGTAGDLHAGISRGAGNGSARGGASIWFVREGNRLPGGVTVTRISARPPGVYVDGAVEAALPYSPRPSGATRVRDRAAGDGP